MPLQPRNLWVDWSLDRAARAGLWALMRVPYNQRVALAGRLLRGIGRIAGFRRRALEQLAYIYPDWTEDARQDVASKVLDNIGRTLIENFSFEDRWARAQRWAPNGPGWAACEAARNAGRPIIVVSGHYGNYQAMQVALNSRGYAVGGLYRPMNNRYFNTHYVRTFEEARGPAFPRGRRGLGDLVRHLRNGGQNAILIDQYFADGVQLNFMGKPAPTALSAAEMALKYDVLLVPIYAERLENGLDFEVSVETPVEHTDPETMTQILNDSLTARVHQHPEQWLWVHRRWKPGRQALYSPSLETAPDTPE